MTAIHHLRRQPFDKPCRSSMRGVCVCCLLFATLSLAGSIFAAPVKTTVPELSSYVDTESSTNIVFNVGRDQDRIFKLTLELNATTNNNVVVALGYDANTNGVLDHAEMDAFIGWDSGEWFYRDRRASIERRISRASGHKMFVCELVLNERKEARRLTVSDGNRGILDEAVPPTMFSAGWNLMCITARGLTEPGGLVVTKTSGWCFKVMLR